MSTKSHRAERIDNIRDLVVLGVTKGIVRRTELYRTAIEEHILLNRSGRPLAYSSGYRYMEVLSFLRFDRSNYYSKDSDIIWSPSARQLATYGQDNYRTPYLSSAEKEVFIENIFRSGFKEQFLSYFCDGVTPDSRSEFVRNGHPLYIIRDKKDVEKTRGLENQEGQALFTPDPSSATIYHSSENDFLYTYRNWSLDLGLIEELKVAEYQRYNISKEGSYVIFPVDPDLQLTPTDLIELIYQVIGGPVRSNKVLPIPVLLYEICPVNKMDLETFKSLLVTTANMYPNQILLERGPAGLIQGKTWSKNRSYSDRYGNHRYYIIVNGTIRSHIVVFSNS